MIAVCSTSRCIGVCVRCALQSVPAGPTVIQERARRKKRRGLISKRWASNALYLSMPT
jgi:hypothetical protein